MNLNKHFEIEGQHAVLGASKWHWINYSREQMYNSYMNSFSQEIGTAAHDFARQYVKHGIKLNKSMKNSLLVHILEWNKFNPIPREAIDIDILYPNLMAYVNDSVGFRMNAEQPVKVNSKCFGTADALSFENGILRIHDLKTGKTPAHIEQLEIYAAMFCLEYHVNPKDIDIQLRIYQNNEVLCHEPNEEEILPIMDFATEYSDMIIDISNQEVY